MMSGKRAQTQFVNTDKDSPVSNLKFEGWYSNEIIQNILSQADIGIGCELPYVMYDHDPAETYFVYQLMELKSHLEAIANRVQPFICKPETGSAHYYAGFLFKEADNRISLLLINPLGNYQKIKSVLTYLEDQALFKNIYRSNNVIQDKDIESEKLVSCGPICVEIVKQASKDISWVSQLKDSTSGTDKLEGTVIDLEKANLMPSSVVVLSDNEDDYKTKMEVIRKSHHRVLATVERPFEGRVYGLSPDQDEIKRLQTELGAGKRLLNILEHKPDNFEKYKDQYVFVKDKNILGRVNSRGKLDAIEMDNIDEDSFNSYLKTLIEKSENKTQLSLTQDQWDSLVVYLEEEEEEDKNEDDETLLNDDELFGYHEEKKKKMFSPIQQSSVVHDASQKQQPSDMPAVTEVEVKETIKPVETINLNLDKDEQVKKTEKPKEPIKIEEKVEPAEPVKKEEPKVTTPPLPIDVKKAKLYREAYYSLSKLCEKQLIYLESFIVKEVKSKHREYNDYSLFDIHHLEKKENLKSPRNIEFAKEAERILIRNKLSENLKSAFAQRNALDELSKKSHLSSDHARRWEDAEFIKNVDQFIQDFNSKSKTFKSVDAESERNMIKLKKAISVFTLGLGALGFMAHAKLTTGSRKFWEERQERLKKKVSKLDTKLHTPPVSNKK